MFLSIFAVSCYYGVDDNILLLLLCRWDSQKTQLALKMTNFSDIDHFVFSHLRARYIFRREFRGYFSPK